jgi:hypothetical protein
MYFDLLMQMKKQLGQINVWLDELTTYATSRSFDPNVLLTARLSPDQFAFVRQVQVTCDMAKYAASRVTGKEAPSHADDEKTIDELRARVTATVTYLETFKAEDFAGAATRKVTTPRWEGEWMTGHDFFLEHAQPNFFFHFTTVYALLRHAGVPVGKRHFLGKVTRHKPE